jgi:hypothetical protein
LYFLERLPCQTKHQQRRPNGHDSQKNRFGNNGLGDGQFFWDFRNVDAQDYFAEKVCLEGVMDPHVDGTFTDDPGGYVARFLFIVPLFVPSIVLIMSLCASQLQLRVHLVTLCFPYQLVTRPNTQWGAFFFC